MTHQHQRNKSGETHDAELCTRESQLRPAKLGSPLCQTDVLRWSLVLLCKNICTASTISGGKICILFVGWKWVKFISSRKIEGTMIIIDRNLE
jgi:hypothetical protein